MDCAPGMGGLFHYNKSIPLLSPIKRQVLAVPLIGAYFFFVAVLTSIPIYMVIYLFLYVGFSLQDSCGHKADKAVTSEQTQRGYDVVVREFPGGLRWHHREDQLNADTEVKIYQ